ncbi:peptidoglycan-associated lipoprotein Pal [Thiomicrorhabdus arctica]|jgi:peptidoglycan-associated lipoprotein|uniref:peptidoglycan-associated lipoprotein Pal n=1 Tax=Thiomicrorhabdus arctica TaxID=131540 RepID=UPI00036080F8|nr:peptidoglycan-associated lipoprotein Pal [Thiomicrorhabdus arctica]
MSIQNVKQLFLVGLLGLTLVGCSSAPKTVEADAEATQVAADHVEQDVAAIQLAAAQALETQKAELLASIQGKVVHFDFDRSDVKSEDYQIIKGNADYMALDGSVSVSVKGHTDERGSREYNLALGERRAQAVKNALIAEGVSPARITVVSYGEDSPIDEAHNESAWTKNRRAEFSY